jgi:hypothetical protein
MTAAVEAPRNDNDSGGRYPVLAEFGRNQPLKFLRFHFVVVIISG